MATRRLVLALGRKLAAAGRLSDPEDVFFMTAEEFKTLAREPSARDWKALVAERRASRRRHAATTVPDFIPAKDSPATTDRSSQNADGVFYGIPIGTGVVEGPVTVVRGIEDIEKVRQGDIIVTEVIDPGMASLLGMAGGVIADMGGTLSHGAIIVREHGIPAIVNATHATSRLRDGERVKLNATEGTAQKTSA